MAALVLGASASRAQFAQRKRERQSASARTYARVLSLTRRRRRWRRMSSSTSSSSIFTTRWQNKRCHDCDPPRQPHQYHHRPRWQQLLRTVAARRCSSTVHTFSSVARRVRENSKRRLGKGRVEQKINAKRKAKREARPPSYRAVVQFYVRFKHRSDRSLRRSRSRCCCCYYFCFYFFCCCCCRCCCFSLKFRDP